MTNRAYALSLGALSLTALGFLMLPHRLCAQETLGGKADSLSRALVGVEAEASRQKDIADLTRRPRPTSRALSQAQMSGTPIHCRKLLATGGAFWQHNQNAPRDLS